MSLIWATRGRAWGIRFLLTGGFMQVFSGWWGLPYLPAQLVTTGIVLFWSFLANKAWTFARS